MLFKLHTKILEVNLFAFAYRLFHRDFSPINGTFSIGTHSICCSNYNVYHHHLFIITCNLPYKHGEIGYSPLVPLPDVVCSRPHRN